jgi:hypothetical protein
MRMDTRDSGSSAQTMLETGRNTHARQHRVNRWVLAGSSLQQFFCLSPLDARHSRQSSPGRFDQTFRALRLRRSWRNLPISTGLRRAPAHCGVVHIGVAMPCAAQRQIQARAERRDCIPSSTNGPTTSTRVVS